MNCEMCRGMFPDFLGEELDGERVEEFQEHVNGCANCRHELALLGETESVLRLAWEDEAIPKSLNLPDLRKISPKRRIGSTSWQMPRFAWLSLTVAACFMLCMGTLAFLNARIQIGETGFSLAFGLEIPESISRRPQLPHLNWLASEAEFGRMVDRRIGLLEKFHGAKLEKALAGIEKRWEQRRSGDLRRIRADLSYLEMLQKINHQEANRNKILISSVADRYVMVRSPDSLP